MLSEVIFSFNDLHYLQVRILVRMPKTCFLFEQKTNKSKQRFKHSIFKYTIFSKHRSMLIIYKWFTNFPTFQLIVRMLFDAV